GRLDQDPRADHARAIEPSTDSLQRLLVGDELLEPQTAIAAAGGWYHENPNPTGIGAVAGRHTSDACHLGRGLPGQVLVVLHGDGAVTGAQHDRSAHFGVLDALTIDATLRCPGTPSDAPSSSFSTSSALTASLVPPMVNALRPLMVGEAL